MDAFCEPQRFVLGAQRQGPRLRLRLRRAAPAQPSGNRFYSAGASKVGALIPPAGRCLSCVRPPRSSSLSQAGPDEAQKTEASGAAPKPPGLFASHQAPAPGTEPGLSGNPGTISAELWMGLGAGVQHGTSGWGWGLCS